MDMSSLLMIPDAPRVSGPDYPRNWDWRIIETDQPLTRIKHTGNNADDDSAFGSAESAKLTEDVVSTEVLTTIVTQTALETRLLTVRDDQIREISYFLLK
jgi:hypothetical protein